MPKRIPEIELQAIETAVASYPQGATSQGVLDRLLSPVPRRTLQYRLRYLVDRGRLTLTGAKRSTRYFVKQPEEELYLYPMSTLSTIKIKESRGVYQASLPACLVSSLHQYTCLSRVSV